MALAQSLSRALALFLPTATGWLELHPAGRARIRRRRPGADLGMWVGLAEITSGEYRPPVDRVAHGALLACPGERGAPS